MLDGIVNMISVVELAAAGANLSALRTFRLFRVFRSLKLLNKHKELRKLTRAVLAGFAALGDFSVLLCLFTFVFCVMGMQMFGGTEQHDEIRRTYDSFGFAFLTCFEMLTANAWDDVMRASMMATSNLACVFYIMWVLLGNFVLLSLFLAILIESMQESNDEDTIVKPDDENRKIVEYLNATELFSKAHARCLERTIELFEMREFKQVIH